MELKGEAINATRNGVEWVFQLGIATHTYNLEELRPPVHMVVVIDGSGSMSSDGKMDKVKRALGTFLTNLRPDDYVSIIRFSDQHHVLALSMHHIISDAWSIAILMSEFAQLYLAHLEQLENPLEPLAIQYADFASWQREHFRSTGENLYQKQTL